MIIIKTNNDTAFEVEFLSCVVDKNDDFRVVDCDSHFCKFAGKHYSKIKEGKLFLLDILVPQERENIRQHLCNKNSVYVYLDLYLKDKSDNFNFVHCVAKNNEENSLCQLTFADVSRSIEKSKKIKERAKTMNHLIDLVDGGVCLFKVNRDMKFKVIFANEACCRIFGTTKDNAGAKEYCFDEVIHPDDKSACYQAIGMAMATGKPIDMDIRIMPHKNEYIWCKWKSSIHKYDKENFPVFHAVFTDISEVKRAEREADKQREMLVKMFKNVPGPVFATDCENPFMLNVVSEDFVKMTGYTRSELFEKYNGDFSKLLLPNEVEAATKKLDFSDGKKSDVTVSYSVKSKSDGYIVVVDRRKLVELESGEKTLIGMLSDITAARLDDYSDI